jgi:myo-inositol-1(or 4)-monophosphatase
MTVDPVDTPRTEVSHLLGAMIDAARMAGEGLRQDFLTVSSLQINHKIDLSDPVSAADLRSEATVRDALSSACPDYGFLGEEGGLVAGKDESNLWIVDPLDGTFNFLCGLPQFAVNIALARDGQVIAGVTHVPMLVETFWAERGKGAWLNGQPITVSTRQDMMRAMLGVGIPFASKPRHGQFLAEMERLMPRVSGIRRLRAGAIDMVYVACGRFDAYWEQSVSPWDMAAGVVIVEEAGGIVTDTLGRPLDLNNGSVLASTPQLHAELLKALEPVDA